jgi:DNA polymerase III epsilon subunit-like protein
MGVQNASFDKNVLEDALKVSGIEWTPSGYIDTKEISSMVLPRWTPENPDGPAKMGSDGVKRPSNGLKEITEYLGVELGTKHHTADADAEATAEVMHILTRSIRSTLKKLKSSKKHVMLSWLK